MTASRRRRAEIAESLAQALLPTVRRLIPGLSDEEAIASARRIVALRLGEDNAKLP